MNLIIGDTYKKEYVNLTNKIIEKLTPTTSLVFCTDEGKKFLDCSKYCKNIILFMDEDLYHANYKDINDCTPLDQNILSKIAPHENQILEIAGRNGALYFGYSKRVTIYQKHLRYWNHILEKYKISLYILYGVPHSLHDIIIYHLCKIKKIKTAFFWESQVPGYSYLIDDIVDINSELEDEYKKHFSQLKQKPIYEITLNADFEKEFLKQTSLSHEDKKPYYMKMSKLSKIEGIIVSYKKYFSTLFKEDKQLIWRLFIMKIVKNFDDGEYLKHYKKRAIKPDLNKDYIYVALHYQPEATTAPLGGIYSDQLLIIQMLSYYLPSDMFLYVKDHPVQSRTGRTRNFLDQILQIKNVVLIQRDFDTYDLLKKCKAVATVTGTIGWEALFQEKPILMFGNHFYKYAPGVFNIRTNNDIIEALDKILIDKWRPNLQEVKIFMKAFEQIAFPSIRDNTGKLTIENNEIIAQKISGWWHASANSR